MVNLTLNSTTYITLIGFIVDATHLRLIENDTTFGTTAGDAIAQGNSTGTFTSDSAFDGTFVYGTQGYGTQGQTTVSLPRSTAGCLPPMALATSSTATPIKMSSAVSSTIH